MHNKKMIACIQIPHSIYQMMLAHLQVTYPQEGCGLLGGHIEQGSKVAHVTHLYVIENHLYSPTAYEMAPTQQLQAMLDLEAQGSDTIAAYHSHPQGQSVPSETDIAQAYYPELVHLIVSLQQRDQPIVRAFHILNKNVEEIALNITT